MKITRAATILVMSILLGACSQKSAPESASDSETRGDSADRAEHASAQPEGENELQPREDEIAEDCVAFVRATKIVPAQAPGAECPACPAEGTEVLAFRQMKTDRITCAGETCQVAVTVQASFNPGTGERISGGLTAWLPPEQRSEYLSGRTPAGEQTYPVRITYKRKGEGWRAVEFDRVEAE